MSSSIDVASAWSSRDDDPPQQTAGPSNPLHLMTYPSLGKRRRKRYVQGLRTQDLAAPISWPRTLLDLGTMTTVPLGQPLLDGIRPALQALTTGAGSGHALPSSLPPRFPAAGLTSFAVSEKGKGTNFKEGQGQTRPAVQDGEDTAPQAAHSDADHHKSCAQDDDSMSSDIALRFFLAGGISGAVSRTVSAPAERLRVYLMTADPVATTSQSAGQNASKGFQKLSHAVKAIHAQGGITTWWRSNTVNVAKIVPESSVRFLSYETAKRFFAQHVDDVADSRDISATSRFLSGGIAGLSSQLVAYPADLIKVRVMVAPGTDTHRLVLRTVSNVYRNEGLVGFYRGCAVSLAGIFPMVALDSTFYEGLRLAYIRYTGRSDPGVLQTLAFGSFSGVASSTCVFPLNVVRTKLQAGQYVGKTIPQVVRSMLEAEGWRAFYRGWLATQLKVIPSVATSWLVYEKAKTYLGVK